MKEKILVINDDDVRELVQAILQNHGYEIYEAVNRFINSGGISDVMILSNPD